MLKYLFIGCLTLIVIQQTIAGATDYSKVYQYFPADSSKIYDINMTTLATMTPSLKGVTSQGNKYTLYAIKKTKGWNFLILDSTGYYSVKQENLKRKERKAGKEAEMIENSQSYTDMLVMMAKAKLLNKKTKPRNVSGLTLSCYYKFKPKAKKMYRSYLQINSRAEFFRKKLKEWQERKRSNFK